MEIWTIYHHPIDVVGVEYVVRRFTIEPDGSVTPAGTFLAANTLEEARSLIPPGLVPFERDSSDDAVIVESWL